LAWGDIAIDNRGPSVTQNALKKIQLRKGIDVYIGKTYCPLCPVVAITQYMAVWGQKDGPFFQFQDERLFKKAPFTSKLK